MTHFSMDLLKWISTCWGHLRWFAYSCLKIAFIHSGLGLEATQTGSFGWSKTGRPSWLWEECEEIISQLCLLHCTCFWTKYKLLVITLKFSMAIEIWKNITFKLFLHTSWDYLRWFAFSIQGLDWWWHKHFKDEFEGPSLLLLYIVEMHSL